MSGLALTPEIVDGTTRAAAIRRLREARDAADLAREADPCRRLPSSLDPVLADTDPDQPHAANLWRVHWFNAADRRRRVDIPGHVVLPP